MTARFERRLKILRGRRQQALDVKVLGAQERAVRARIARKVRFWLRQRRPVVLFTPRWSAAPRFLDDVAGDLQVGEPVILARVLSVAPLAGRPLHESWGWLVKALTEFFGIDLGATVAQAVSRQGFRTVLGAIFRRSLNLEPRVLLIHGVEHLPVEAREDLLIAFQDHQEVAGPSRTFTPLLAVSSAAANFVLEGAAELTLVDYSRDEAVEALAEYLGAIETERLRRAIDVIGGVPALIDRIGSEADASGGRLSSDRDAIWRALGPLAEEIRGAVAIAAGASGVMDRLEEVSRFGTVTEGHEADAALVSAGLVERRGERDVALRAAVLSEIAAR